MASDELDRRAPSPPEPERGGAAPDADDDVAQLSEDDLRGIAAIRRRLDIEFGVAPGEPPSPVPERARRRHAPARAPRAPAPAPRASAPTPRARAARHAPRAVIAALMLLAGGFIGFISAVVTYVMLESSAPPTSAGGAAAPANVAAPPPAPGPPPVEPSASAAVPELPPRPPTLSDLRDALGQWIEATRRRDIDGQMALYPERVDVYYTWRNVSRAAVRREKERVFADATVINVATGPAEITTRPDGKTAVTRFRKRYVIEGPRVRRRGEVVQELRWVRTADGWKITAERDAEVLS